MLTDAGQGLTPAGYWYAFVALPIFQFLMFRWLYRMGVLSRFLWSISKLDLLLTPTHPDGAGGTAFLGKALIPFGAPVRVERCVSSAIARQILLALIVFAGPMLILLPKLLALKQRGLMDLGNSFDIVRKMRILPVAQRLHRHGASRRDSGASSGRDRDAGRRDLQRSPQAGGVTATPTSSFAANASTRPARMSRRGRHVRN
jgi:hypothetical protein